MTILSFSFLLFVLALLIIYYIIPRKYRWVVLLLGSIVFYFLSSKWLVLYPIFTTIVIFFVGLFIDKKNKAIRELNESKFSDEEKTKLKNDYKKAKKRAVFWGVILTLLCIVLTKYAGFVLENVNGLLRFTNFSFGAAVKYFLVPLGISYYTLEAISYIVDIYRGKCEASKNIFKVALYLLYFPKVIEGPFSRFKELNQEFMENNALNFENIIIGLDFIMYGLFKKMVIADRAGIFVNQVFGGTFGGITTFLAMVLYTVQIYAEFSGCIDIVRGVSYLFGIKLPVNFKRPFFSKSIQEFWQRWHISLGAWIKEYVFFPISLSKMNAHVCKFCKEKMSQYWFKFISVAFPLFFVWIVNGIWHGASYKYVVYGMYYYVFMMLALLVKPWTDKILKKMKINEHLLNGFRIIRTILFVVVGMALFRASSLSEFAELIGSLFKGSAGVLNHGLVTIDFILLIIANLLVLIVSILEEKEVISLENGFTKKVWVRALAYSFILCSLIIFGIYGEGYDASEFIYGAF